MSSDLRTQFLNYMTVQRLSQHTKRNYIRAVKELAKFYNQSPDTLTNDHPWVIIYKAALTLAINLDYQAKIPVFSQLYQEALRVLRHRDWEYKNGGDNGGLDRVDYMGF